MHNETESARRMSAILYTKTWFGFDLDDTLHEFRKASRAATTACLCRLAQEYKNTNLEVLQEEYQNVLKQSTSNAFVDGRSSHDYRRERLVALLDHFSLDHRIMTELLSEYETALVQNLQLKQGALSLLQCIKRMGRKIVIITEGPQDAQERTIEHLGIAEYVDYLATSNCFRVSKTSGLFRRVLDYLEIDPTDIVFVGDSMERDIEPARAEGLHAILYAEGQGVSFDSSPPRVSSLEILANMLQDSAS